MYIPSPIDLLDLNDFNETGYVVIDNWLDQEECNQFLLDYSQAITIGNGYDPNIRVASDDILEKFESKILDVCKLINQQCGGDINSINPPWWDGAYWDSSYINFDWHQDHESTYVFQNLNEYLNCYIIVKKEHANFSGLSIIPENKLKQEISRLQNNFIFNGRGAKHFITNPDNKTTVAFDDCTGNEITLDIDINDLAVTPATQTGDLLLLKGTSIHKSQPLKKGHRIALSVRCLNENALLSASWFTDPKLTSTDAFNYYISTRKKFYDQWSKALHTKEVQTIKEVINNFKGLVNGRT